MNLPWHAAAWSRLVAARASGRLAHALLFCGEPGLGQVELAERFFSALLCSAPVEEEACDRCRACQLRQAGTHPDAHRIGLMLRDDGRLRGDIGVDQIRELSAKLALTAQAFVQVALIHPADAMNANAANSLLKTLEEPMPGRFLLLTAENVSRLPNTIRSRCQRIELRAPGWKEARAHFLSMGRTANEVESALAIGDGHPGLAARLLEDGGLALCRDVAADLDALSAHRISPIELAAKWAADRLEARLWSAALECRQRMRRRLEARSSESVDVEVVCPRKPAAPGANRAGLTATGLFPKLVNWFEGTNRLRAQLWEPLRHELLLADLLNDWQNLRAD